MTDFFAFTIVGIVFGAIYAVAASGLVVTYTTSGIFNFAHGAIGMVAAFAYWELRVNQAWPAPLALFVVVLVLAPLFGAVVERVLMRRLHGQSVGVSLVVTIGLLAMLFGAASSMWPATEGRRLPDFFAGRSITLFDVVVPYHNLIVLAVAVAVAFGLRILLFRTRIGVAMRAVVDDRELASQNGALPERVSQLSWALGAMLAAIAGLLLAPELQMNHLELTLLVVNGYAAAMLGRLRSLPLTFVGALVIGLFQSYLVGYGSRLDIGRGLLGDASLLLELRPALPMIFLLLILVFLPQVRLRAGRVVGESMPKVPDLQVSLRAAGAFVAAALLLSTVLSNSLLLQASTGLVLGVVMLSLVLLSGYGGQISLFQVSLLGLGAVVMGKVAESGGVHGVVLAAVAAGIVGALFALPALRLQDLYLALTTFAVAVMADVLFFKHPDVFGENGSVFVEQLSLLGLDLDSPQSLFVVAAVAFAGIGVLVLAVRRGPFGRRLAAMRDSPAACATLGMNLLGTKVAVFALSAAIAGFGGALFVTVRGTAGSVDFLVLQSLFVFLLAMIGGITSVTGAFIGGVVYALLPEVQQRYFPSLALDGLFIGIGAIVISRYPNGFAGLLFEQVNRLRRRATGRSARPVGVAPAGAEQSDRDLVQVPA